MKPKPPIESTDKGAFFDLLKRASQPLSPKAPGRSAPGESSGGGYSGKQTRSHKPANAAGKPSGTTQQ